MIVQLCSQFSCVIATLCYMDFILKDGSEYDIGGPIGRCDHYVVVGMRLAIFTTIDAESCD